LDLKSLRAFALMFVCSAVLPTVAHAESPSAQTGGATYTDPPVAPANLVVPGAVAQLLPDGTAAAPADAPAEVQNAVFAANRIKDKPYVYGGGHGKFEARGYDCSGTVSYALHGGGLLKSPLDSSSFMRWGAKGPGAWITVFTNPGHAYAVIAGLRLDTSTSGYAATRSAKPVAKSAYERGPRWRATLRSSRGYRARHPLGF
jgi:cell wall-associated NlpC family hydrolase